jgi:predicted GIY-YIG superfamily endonuclease
MHYVYILRSMAFPEQRYIGACGDLKKRFADHNAGKSPHTAKFVPWSLECYLAFSAKQQAYDFEKYLKSHSGRAFATKRLCSRE